MFETMTAPLPDKILSLMELFRADPRAGKMDLGVGVYRDEAGVTPILPSVRRVEAALDAAAQTKAYVGPAGDPLFVERVLALAFGADAPAGRIGGVQAVGGAGALRILTGLIARQAPGAVVHVPDPTWINHLAIIESAGLASATYRYYDPATGGVDMAGLLADMEAMRPGDVMLLHGCCHNPTGADPRLSDWVAIADMLVARGIVPFVDIAYQGFGDGLDEDAAALRMLAQRVPEMLVAYSCSKNFGIYRDRAGAAFVLARDAAAAQVARARLAEQNRIACSMPPDHGAAIVREILGDAALRAEWAAEVAGMRARVRDIRQALSSALAAVDGARFGTLAGQKGMFSLLPLSEAEVARLQADHGIYLVSDGRISLAGLRRDQVPLLAAAVGAVI